MKAKTDVWGILEDGRKAHIHRLQGDGLGVSLCDYGASIVSIRLPAKLGYDDDICLGFSSLSGYLGAHPFFGCTVGRFANRIANAAFTIDGHAYNLEPNEGVNTLHGGFSAWDKRLWQYEPCKNGIRFKLESPDGDGGFPGRLEAEVLYRLEGRSLTMRYRARCDKDCHINMTNHSYFNLNGQGCGDILGHELWLNSDSYVEVDQANIPSGKIIDAAGGAFDFSQAKRVGKDIAGLAIGYDHCFVVKGKKGELRKIATLSSRQSGRSMTISGTQEGVQLYSAFHLNSITGKRGGRYGRFGGLCLETQAFPDAPNKDAFPSSLIKAGEEYEEKVVYDFEWNE